MLNIHKMSGGDKPSGTMANKDSKTILYKHKQTNRSVRHDILKKTRENVGKFKAMCRAFLIEINTSL